MAMLACIAVLSTALVMTGIYVLVERCCAIGERDTGEGVLGDGAIAIGEGGDHGRAERGLVPPCRDDRGLEGRGAPASF
jgi:hypothetical protein